MKIKTSELTGAALDWAVAKAEGINVGVAPAFTIGTFKKIAIPAVVNNATPELAWPRVSYYSTDWAQAGAIIEREGIDLNYFRFDQPPYWTAHMVNSAANGKVGAWAPTPLIAAMRCFVASRLGEEMEVPDELA